eukprot:PRCOL_00004295-RA
MSDSDSDSDASVAPLEAVEVFYCGVSGLPPEYIEWLGKDEVERCKPWLKANYPRVYELWPEWEGEDGGSGDAGEGPSAQAGGAGGEGADAAADELAKLAVGDKEKKSGKGGKKKKKEKELVVTKAVRNKRKCITTVTGLHHWKVKLSEASKLFGKKFACGASVTKNASQVEEIDIQGDCLYEVTELILKKYPDVDKDAIYWVEDKKKRKADL